MIELGTPIRAPFGAGSTKGGSSGATEDPNTLRAKETARVLYVIGEGVLELIDGGKSIYFDNTPLIGSDGLANFSGVAWEWRSGLADQAPITGFDSIENPVDVNVTVTYDTPIVRTITSVDVDAVRILSRIPQLTEQDTEDGDLHGSSVSYAIDFRVGDGGWTEVFAETIEGKCVSAYPRDVRIALPAGRPVAIRYRRTKPDATSAAIADKITWLGYAEIIDGKYSYPHTALLALTFDPKDFGSSLPTVSVDAARIDTPIPVGYDPVARTYPGTWDGTFTTGCTDNPAWILYQILTEDRWGLGLARSRVDKWMLYQIARWADGLVNDGLGGQEPRYRFNGVLTTQAEAYDFITSVCAAFRGMAWWASGTVAVSADMPEDDWVLPITPSNVIEGSIEYQGTALSARHNSCVIWFNDPDNAYQLAPEVYNDYADIAKRGLVRASYTLIGCTGRSYARRQAKWVVLTEARETDTALWAGALDHYNLRPGSIVPIFDPRVITLRRGGRLLAATLTRVTLDAPVVLSAGQSYRLLVAMPDGSLAERPVTTGAGETATIDLSPDLPALPVDHAVWGLTGSDAEPRRFRVLGVKLDKIKYTVTALYHDPGKFAEIEAGLTIDTPKYTIGSTRPDAPTGLTAVESTYVVNGLPHARLTVSWIAIDSATIARYSASVLSPAGLWTAYEPGRTTTIDVAPADEGAYTIRVVAVTYAGLASTAAEITVTVHGKSTPPGPCTGLAGEGGLHQIAWTWVLPADTDLGYAELLVSATPQLADAAPIAKVRGTGYIQTGVPSLADRWAWVRAVDISGNVGAINSSVGTKATAKLVDITDIPDDFVTASKLAPELRAEVLSIEDLAESYTNLATNQAATDSALSVVREDVETNASATTALAAHVETVTTTVGESTAAVQEMMQSVDGIKSTWTIKTQVTSGGKQVIAGIGLMADIIAGKPTSEIILDATKTAIGVVDDDGSVTYPFIVEMIDGKATVYLAAALIGTATIGTLHLKDQAVITQVYGESLAEQEITGWDTKVSVAIPGSDLTGTRVDSLAGTFELVDETGTTFWNTACFARIVDETDAVLSVDHFAITDTNAGFMLNKFRIEASAIVANTASKTYRLQFLRDTSNGHSGYYTNICVKNAVIVGWAGKK